MAKLAESLLLEDEAYGSCENGHWIQAAEAAASFYNTDNDSRSEAIEVVLDAVSYMDCEHGATLTTIVDKLDLTVDNYVCVFYQVADVAVSTAKHTWGLVLTIMAFSEYMVRVLPTKGELIGKMVGVYILTRMGRRVRNDGGWCGFYDF